MTTRLKDGQIAFDPPNVTVVAPHERTLKDWFDELYKAAHELIETGETTTAPGMPGHVVVRPPKRLKGWTQTHYKWDALYRVLDNYAKEYVEKNPTSPKTIEEATRNVIRDAFLEGRDEEAIEVMLTEFVRISIPADVMERLNITYAKQNGKLHIIYTKKSLSQMGPVLYKGRLPDHES